MVTTNTSGEAAVPSAIAENGAIYLKLYSQREYEHTVDSGLSSRRGLLQVEREAKYIAFSSVYFFEIYSLRLRPP